MNYVGRTAPWQIIRQVKPKLSRIIKRHSEGDEAAQCENEIWDGENLSTMVTLYKCRGKIDLIVADPPYNTGEDFRYNDKWDTDPNDPDLGDLVPKDDGSRHSKWLKFMTPRLWMMREMLKPELWVSKVTPERIVADVMTKVPTPAVEARVMAEISRAMSSDAARDVLEVICAAYASAGDGGTEVPVPFAGDRTLTPMHLWRG